MNKILIIADYFKPGYKAGGPIQSLSNIVTILKKSFNVYLINKNHDFGEIDSPYKDIKYDSWFKSNEYGINLYYITEKNISLKTYKEIIKKVNPDYIYLNSFFSPGATIFPLLTFPKNSKLILAPRGELSNNALKIKKIKKYIYLLFFRLFLKKYISKYHATSKEEYKQIVNQLKVANGKVVVISNPPYQGEVIFEELKKIEALADFVMISRISRIKNIDFLLDVLKDISKSIRLHIYGINEDKKYWKLCEQKIKVLPKNIKVEYRGSVNNDKVLSILKKYRFFISPSKSENFGHSIFEALIAGTPVIISDRTPWRKLENDKIGWDIPLEDRVKWKKILERGAEMGDEEYSKLSQNSQTYANEFRFSSNLISGYNKLFGK